ncbi:MAG: Mth938-like domain-containing protein [Chloroflexota bacterium]|nr:Mth938-like domain-containing protein [Chloroflexota bacterium]
MIESYSFGRIVINGRPYTSDVVILADRVFFSWWRQEGHELAPADLDEVIAARPDVLVVGTGHSGLMRILPETETYLAEQNIQILAERTTDACQTYNRLRRSGQNVVAALHITC